MEVLQLRLPQGSAPLGSWPLCLKGRAWGTKSTRCDLRDRPIQFPHRADEETETLGKKLVPRIRKGSRSQTS